MIDFFKELKQLPADPILGLVAQFIEDPRPNKINLSIGVYFDEKGNLVNFDAIDTAQKAVSQHFYSLPSNIEQKPVDLSLASLVPAGTTIAYLPATGYACFDEEIRELVFPSSLQIRKDERIESMESIAGSGALRLSADFLCKKLGKKRVFFSNPTWSNHYQLFGSAGLETGAYSYYDRQAEGINIEKTLADFETYGDQDVVLLQASCHNPTGYDFTLEQWKQVLEVCKRRNIFVVFDCAYQGFGDGLDGDVASIRLATEILDEFLVCTSCSKNFGLYGERIGALHVVGKDKESAQKAISNLQQLATDHYCAPGGNAAYIVATILKNPELKANWIKDVDTVRNRIKTIREKFAKAMQDRGVNFDFIIKQKGMFSYANFNEEQVKRLKDEFAIYLVGNGRINVVGINDQNLEYLADSFATVALGK